MLMWGSEDANGMGSTEQLDPRTQHSWQQLCTGANLHGVKRSVPRRQDIRTKERSRGCTKSIVTGTKGCTSPFHKYGRGFKIGKGLEGFYIMLELEASCNGDFNLHRDAEARTRYEGLRVCLLQAQSHEAQVDLEVAT